MGRELQKQEGQKPQTIMMMPLLEGTDGIKKMSKSLGNYIGIDENPDEMFGKIMSISDQLMWRYYDLLSLLSTTEIESFKQEVMHGANPRDYKIKLAQEIITRYHSAIAATNATENFINRFQKGVLPEDIPVVEVKITEESIMITQLLKQAGLVDSTSDAIRMIDQAAVKIDGEKISDKNLKISKNTQHVYQVGKRKIAKILT